MQSIVTSAQTSGFNTAIKQTEPLIELKEVEVEKKIVESPEHKSL